VRAVQPPRRRRPGEPAIPAAAEIGQVCWRCPKRPAPGARMIGTHRSRRHHRGRQPPAARRWPGVTGQGPRRGAWPPNARVFMTVHVVPSPMPVDRRRVHGLIGRGRLRRYTSTRLITWQREPAARARASVLPMSKRATSSRIWSSGLRQAVSRWSNHCSCGSEVRSSPPSVRTGLKEREPGWLLPSRSMSRSAILVRRSDLTSRAYGGRR